MPTYCEIGSQEARERLDDHELKELIGLHHLACDLNDLKGSDVTLRLVAQDGGRACHRIHGKAHGFVYPDAPHAAHVRADVRHKRRRYVLMHEVRHCWQFIRGASIITKEAEEGDADGFASRYLPKLRGVLFEINDAIDRRAPSLLKYPKSPSLQSRLDELAHEIIGSLGIGRPSDHYFSEEAAQDLVDQRRLANGKMPSGQLCTHIGRQVYQEAKRRSGRSCGCDDS